MNVKIVRNGETIGIINGKITYNIERNHGKIKYFGSIDRLVMPVKHKEIYEECVLFDIYVNENIIAQNVYCLWPCIFVYDENIIIIENFNYMSC